MEATSWWHGRIVAGLASYWVYQHLGNMSPAERAADEIWREIAAHTGETELDLTARLGERMRGGFRHLLVGTSLPFLLPPGLHHLESWDEAVSTGASGRPAAGWASACAGSSIWSIGPRLSAVFASWHEWPPRWPTAAAARLRRP
ncbi:hypothetical protein SAMN05216368_10242 [Cryobacterium flavum]|uniref:Uncharacterized protein n=1 Tax=Cryobacterium flavum TaxID=1424659 RepID=A0A5E9FWJ1_9MICO|nr:hypothetical protein [Cryobacterium flavum]SDM69986.1 hypothetical protein SAMN05216368_10242 [Cryobacterium flavum]